MREQLAVGMDGVMIGRLARDDPFFFARVDAQIFGDVDAFAGLSPLEARLRVLERYAEYCAREQRDRPQTAREMLLIPTNHVLEGVREKATLAALLRGTPPRSRPPLFGEELLLAVERVRTLSRPAPAQALWASPGADVAALVTVRGRAARRSCSSSSRSELPKRRAAPVRKGTQEYPSGTCTTALVEAMAGLRMPTTHVRSMGGSDSKRRAFASPLLTPPRADALNAAARASALPTRSTRSSRRPAGPMHLRAGSASSETSTSPTSAAGVHRQPVGGRPAMRGRQRGGGGRAADSTGSTDKSEARKGSVRRPPNSSTY